MTEMTPKIRYPPQRGSQQERRIQMLGQVDSHNLEPTEILKAARRQLEDIKGYQMLEDMAWDYAVKKWRLTFKISIESYDQDLVPNETVWHVLVDHKYPAGNILVMPDGKDGITTTFQHQDFNHIVKDRPWSSGKLCLDESQGSWGRKQYLAEPKSGTSRLYWHIDRCKSWLTAASNNTLVEDGDPFELPAFPPRQKYQLFFNENRSTFGSWCKSDHKEGTFTYKQLSKDIYAVLQFKSDNFSIEPNWGKYITNSQNGHQHGIWIVLDNIPVISPWQIPTTFGELIEILNLQKIDLLSTFVKQTQNLKKQGSFPNVVFLGFPVAERIGQGHHLMHWFAFSYPQLPKIKGFRPNATGLSKHLIKLALQPNKKINWIKTDNWNQEQLTNRGRMIKDTSEMKVLLIGAGSVGSIFIQSLVRLGINNIKVIDPDTVVAGNLSRHILTLDSVGFPKAEALSNHLNSIFPSVHSTYENSSLEEAISENKVTLSDFDIIIEATGQDSVITFLNDSLVGSKCFFTSISTGYMADTLYLYTIRLNRGKQNFSSDFNAKSKKWLENDAKKVSGEEQLIEGIGCWHPLFPARIDDIQMLAGAAVKSFEKQIFDGDTAKLTVIQKQYNNDTFTGIKIFEE
ncbi:ThiF family adenylyltransferase [Chryseobacterium sp. Y16C]|uniref:ThiF family adenylyltransferase n=1 Tax=Chryseobacterium sp. Y16C TaxID=2920939 RepID=UPI001F0AB390|nr:ThiF family adenylyltransferase [Chryseobacterium sp. Y16C]UMQ43046.1 ThiF family adenylyltransferase [Chryseobacterium sp. Y16C]